MAISQESSGITDSGSTSSFSLGVTITLANKIVVWVNSQTTNGASSVNLNGSLPFTFINGATQAGVRGGLWYLDNPPVGAGTINAVLGGAGQAGHMSFDTLIGTNPGVDNSGANNTGASNSLTITFNTVSNNCWCVMGFGCGNNQGPSGGANTTIRQAFNNGNGDGAIADTNGPVTPAGSISMTISVAGSGNMAAAMASFAPKPPSPVTPCRFVMQAVNRSNTY